MGTTPGGRGRFPGYDVLGQASHWDSITREVVERRLEKPPAPRFFSREEEATCRALLDLLLAQWSEPKVPVFEMVDSRLVENRTDGYRYEDMPPDGEAWKASLAALEKLARGRKQSVFHALSREEQVDLLESVRTGDRLGELSAKRTWSLWLRYACSAFYAHPWAWNEIGFGGPAYPRGYKNVGLGARESWMVREVDASSPVAWGERVERARREQRLRDRREIRVLHQETGE